MNDITPEVIAAIATRLYNESAGMDRMPRLDSAAIDPAMQATNASPMPAASLPTNRPSMPVASAASPVLLSAYPAAPWAAMDNRHAMPSAPDASSAASSATSTANSSVNSSEDGLKAFVRSIRMIGVQNPSGQCSPGLDASRSKRTQTGQAPAVDASRSWHVPSIRKDFPILDQQVHGKSLVWFDNAATTQKPQSVIDAIANFYAHDNSNIHRAAHTLAARATDAYEQARQKVQSFVGAGSAREIVFVRGTTEGINLIAQTYGRKFLQPGDEIVLSVLEHHANIVPWQMIAQEKGAVMRVIPVNDQGEVMLEQYQALLGPRTRIVSLTHASNALGTILPIAEMTQMAKRYGARVLIDGAQSIAHVPVNVQQLGCDFFVFSGHKIFGPTGIGAVFAKEELLEVMPPWQGGGSMIRNVTFEETTYAEPPAKFEAGTPNIGGAVGLRAALDYVDSLGRPNIARHEQELVEYATERLSMIDGLRIIGTAREKVAVISFVLRNRRTEDVGRMLDMAGIAVRAGHHCAQPSLRRFGLESTVRPSFSIYNTKDEIDRLVDALRQIQHG